MKAGDTVRRVLAGEVSFPRRIIERSSAPADPPKQAAGNRDLGALTERERDVLSLLGSGSSVLLNIGPELRSAGEGAVSTVAWTHQGKATYSFEGIINYSAATIDWLKNQLGIIKDVAETEAAAKAVEDNGGVYLVNPRVLAALDSKEPRRCSLETDLMPALLAAGARVHGLECPGRFLDIGVPADYARAAEVVSPRSP